MSISSDDQALEGIAVIGMACRFPGANSVDAFWENIKNGVESVTFFSDEELRGSGVSPALLSHPNYVKAAAILDDIDRFDAAFFGYHRREAEILDPQQRLFLECAYTALEHAGYDPEHYQGAIGVYAGVGANTYLFNLMENAEIVDTIGGYQLRLANEKDFLATRLAYKLNLKGPSATVQTACSTSLVATHMACQSLLNFDSDVVLVGAVSLSVPQKIGYMYQEGSILSPDGHCRAFDARAAGTIGGSGVGVIVLKRLADAIADRDSIHAVIRSSAINNDGSLKVGFTAPSQDGQAAVIAEALALAGVEPETIGYIEAHGTGTPVGDPIELAALNQVFRQSTSQRGFCAIGSVKTNIGHLDTAAGIAGLIKAILALKHKQIPPSLHYEQPNPKIDFADSPFYVNSTLRDWPGADAPRRAGVSSFGIGGTNAHIILEEAPPAVASQPARPAQLLVISARTATALDSATAQLATYLKGHAEVDLADVAHTLQVGRRAFDQRWALACATVEEAVTLLETCPPHRVFIGSAMPQEPALAFLLPGQGTQHEQMAAAIYRSEPVFRAQLDRCAELLRPHLGLDLRELIYPTELRMEDGRSRMEDHESAILHPPSSILDQTWLAQPALFAIEYALAQLWMSWGVYPQALLGHSVGEYVAACLAGVFSLEDALALVAARGRLMQQLPSGAMLALPLSEQELQPLLDPPLALAAINGPSACVVAGPTAAVEALAERLATQGVEGRMLHVSHAFHSAMMDPILAPFTQHVAQVRLNAPRIPFISCVTGTWITADEATSPAYWSRQLRATVRFADGLRSLLETPDRLLLECGPGQSLTALARRHPARASQHILVASLGRPKDSAADAMTLRGALGQIWVSGMPIAWEQIAPDQQGRRIPLPTYPFERERYWIDSAAPADSSVIGMEMTVTERETAPRKSARYEQIMSTLGALITRLTGMQAHEIANDISLFDVGFDSLLLIQFNQAIQDSLGVKISLVQLLEQYTTLESIAGYIDQTLPPEQAPPPPSPASISVPRAPATPAPLADASPPIAASAPSLPPAPTPFPQPYVIPTPAAPGHAGPQVGAGALEQIVAQQLHLMTQQLDILRGNGMGIQHPAAPTPTLGAPIAPSITPAPPMPASPVEQTSALPVPPVNGSQRIPSQTYNPYRPVELRAGSDLSPRQQHYLEQFIARYTRRTRRSKELTQQYRPFFSDSRSTAVFRLIWKELIYPIIGHRSAGSRIWDADGNECIDFTMGFGVHLFGHSPPFIMQAMEEQMKIGVHLGPQSYLAGEVSRLICELTGVERVNFCNSGTEAVMGALRIARTVTRRTKIACFAGSYHGWADGTLARPLMVDGQIQSVPVAPGIPPHAVEDMLVLDYDSPRSLEILREHAHELAAVLVEPVQSRRPELQPRAFLHALRELTAQAGIPLIFDEMVNGFRIHAGGAQAYFGIQADIVTYGKIIGGGLPIGVIAGKAQYMDAFDGGMWNYGDDTYPQAEKTLFAGAFFKHPLTMAAALAVLNHMQAEGPALHERLNQRTTYIAETLNDYFAQRHVPIHVVHFSSVFRFNLAHEAKYLDLFFYHLTEKGIYNWEGGNFFLSTAHSDEDIEYFIRAVKESIEELRAGGFLPDLPPDSSNGHASGGSHTLAMNGVNRPPAAPVAVSSADAAIGSADLPAIHTLGASQGLQFSLYYFGAYDSHYSSDKYDLLIQGARFADRHGFEAVWIPERHFHAFGGFSPNPSVVAAALARETERIHIRAGSVALPLHHPIRVAEEWSIVDNLSRGRVGISFASGWHPDDFVFAPDAYEKRREIMLEGIETIHKLWRGEPVRVRGGAGHDLDARLFPMPHQQRLPSWLTCVHKDTYAKAGALGLNVLTNLIDQSVEELGEKIAIYREARAQHGYDPQTGHVTVLVHTFLMPSQAEAIEKAREPFYNYLRSSLGLLRNMAKSQGRQIDLERMDEAEMRYLLADAYNRIAQSTALIGTPDSCAPIVDRLLHNGVDEIACLIDFGVDTPSALASLQQLDLLKERFSHAPPAQPRETRLLEQPIGARDAPQRFPLTEPQKGLWVLGQFGSDEARLYNESVTLRLRGPLQVAALRRAIQAVVDRHDSLRTTFASDGEYQYVTANLAIDLPLDDLCESAADQREAMAAELLTEAASQPFDLANGPLLRVRLVKLQPEEHLLSITLHHIITDGWSTAIILQELGACYTAACQGKQAALPAPSQFKDYLAWLERQEHSAAMPAAEAYWLDRFSKPLPVLELPTDRPRLPLRSYNGAQYVKRIEPENSRALKALAAQQGATLLMVLLAGFNTLLHRLSGQHDLIVGVPAAGQPAAGTPYLTGYCLNLLSLRSTISPQLSFTEYLAAIRRMVLEAYEHQCYSFGKLVRALQLEPDLSRSPLVTVVFNLENTGTSGDSASTWQDLEIETVPHFSGFARFDININVVEVDGALELRCDYNTDLFDQATIRRWLDHFETLLGGIVAAPSLRLTQLPLLTDSEREELLTTRNATRTTYPSDSCFHQLFEAQVKRTPKAVAVSYGGQQLTYRELDERANQLAHHLQALGVGPEVRVGVCFERSFELVVALLGIWKAGGAFVPFDPTFPTERMAYILDDAAVAVVLTQAHLQPRLPTSDQRPTTTDDRQGDKETRRQGDNDHASRITHHETDTRHSTPDTRHPTPDHRPPTTDRSVTEGKTSVRSLTPNPQPLIVCLDADWDTIAQLTNTPPASGASAANLAYQIYTSGSTGRPKGVLIPHRGLVNYLAWCTTTYGAANGRGAPVHASIAADAIFTSLFAPLLVGASVVLMPEEQPLEALGDALQHQGPFSLVKITPSQLEVLRLQLPAAPARDWARTVVLGAEQLRGEMLTFWRQHAPDTVLVNEYGPTETVVGCSIYQVPPDLTIRGTVPIGLPIANTQFYVLDAQMQPLPVGIPGELYIGGDGVAWGYQGRPDLTAEKFVPNPFTDQVTGYRSQVTGNEEASPIPYPLSPVPSSRLYKTGDLVRALSDRAGNIEFLGRIDDQVKIRGYRVEPGEVAEVLVEHPAVREAVVLAREDAPGDRRLVAYVVPTNDQRPTTDDDRQGDTETKGQGDGEAETQHSTLNTQNFSPILHPPSAILGELRGFLKGRLPEYMVPAAFVFLEAIPLAPHGKIDRRALPAPDATRPDLESCFVPPRTPVEEQIVGLWRQVLNVEQIGMNDNFFDLGGDSLLAVRLIARLRDAFHIELPTRTLFEHPTVAALAEEMAQGLAEDVDDETIAQMLAELEALPDGDVQALLADVQ
jgi:iturin family lipopeptide synthetase A